MAALRLLRLRGSYKQSDPDDSRNPKQVVESTALSLGLSALLGLVVALVVYPPSFLVGDAARFYNFVFPNDALDYRLAWQALVDHGRPWPSLWTDLFNYPDGFPISLMDGLPLAATIFRPFIAWLPEGFHYFGLWHAVVVTLQAVAGAVFVRAAGVRHLVPCLLAAAFALAMPIFVGRINWAHVALSTQGLLILALALCVYASRERPSLAFLFPRATALSLIALAVHPLLALQVLLFCLLATALSQAPILRRAGAAAILCLLFLALCQALGIVAADSFASDLPPGEFGFSPLGMIIGEPDSLREIYDARGPGIEQDAWLGAGCVLLVFIGLAVPPRFRIPRAYFALSWTIVALAIVAVSPWVRLGVRIFDFSFLLPDTIIDLYAIHRATVRLAWPLVISLSLLALVHFVVAWPRRRTVPLLAIAFAFQLYSVWPYWTYEYRDARVDVRRLAPLPKILEGGSILISVKEEATAVTYHPRYAMHLAVESGLPLEGGRFSRPPPSERNLHSKDLELPNEAGVRYLVPVVDPANLPKRLPQVSYAVVCEPWEILLVCRAERTQSSGTAPVDDAIGVPSASL